MKLDFVKCRTALCLWFAVFSTVTVAQDLSNSTAVATGATQPISLGNRWGAISTVLDFGAKDANFAQNFDSTAAFASALASGKDYIFVPKGKYLISSSLTIPSGVVIQFSNQARLVANANNLTFFKVASSAYGSQVRDATLDGTGKTNVTGFDLSSFRSRARIDNVRMENMDYGIVLRSLCWDIVIDNPNSQGVKYPIWIMSGSNVVDIRHPALDTYIWGVNIEGGTYPTVGVTITGGFIQNGQIGIVDKATATRIHNTYFEGNSASDIALMAAINPEVSGTLHYANVGQSAIRAVQTKGAVIKNPLMTSGSRSIGLFDVDATNVKAFAWVSPVDGVVNKPLGISAGLGWFVTTPTSIP